ncbi:MAG: VWA-like domain-containing protein, partial [Burkholderiaceae bacterium]
VAGGGGTDFTPLLEAADADGADIGVFLTDLDGPANYRPRFPVVWAVADLFTRLRAPFGSMVSLS